jgi:S-adenosylmethionine:tRNA ribosyltransferase-isomerase
MRRSDFAYQLPPELMAQEPGTRGRSRMMIVEPGSSSPAMAHALISDFPSLLQPGDVMVVNNTRVFPARLLAAPRGNMTRPIEILLTRRLAVSEWEGWCKPARRVRPGDTLHFSEQLHADVLEKKEGTVVLRFDVAEETFWTEVERVGLTPLPPYIRRPQPEASDREAYQTVYASERGAVAAPTAGLHFTKALLDACVERGVALAEITLHVGLGTFAPMKVEEITDHVMHSEEYEIGAGAAAAIGGAREAGGRVVAIGTTVVRALESAADEQGVIWPHRGGTSIFITPGYAFRCVDALLTNFHLPESTLLMLVSAFAGVETIREAYRTAIGERYLFFSYGDCMFLTKRGAF